MSRRTPRPGALGGVPKRRALPRRAAPRESPAPARGAGAYALILAVVRRIPRGKVATYGQVAALAGFPNAPRLAGYALHAQPDGTPIPWHRVLGAGGRLTLARLNPEGALLQRLRLEAEGVAFDARGRARLDRCGWKPRGIAAGPARPRRPGSPARAGSPRRVRG